MILAKKTRKKIFHILLLVILLFTVISTVKTVLVSIDIDESYAVTQAYRLAMGDRMILDMWEPHQFSAYLSAFFIRIYLLLFGTTTGIVVFLRLCGFALHLLLGAALYAVFRKFVTRELSLLLCLLHLNFLAKWIQLPEFELMQYWLVAFTFIAFARFYLGKHKKAWLLTAGFSMMLQLLNYPTMLLLYPFYIIGIFKISETKKEKWQNAGLVTLGAIIPGVTFLLYLLSYMSPATLWHNLSYILSDPSHNANPLYKRLGTFGLEFFIDLLELCGLFLLCLLFTWGINRLRSRKLPRRSLVISAALTETVLLCLVQFFGCLFFDQNQFFLQNRYLLLTLSGIFLFLSEAQPSDKDKLLFHFCLVPGIISAIATLLLTNMSVNTAYSKLFPCVFAVFLYLGAREKQEKGEYLFSVLALLGSLLVCKLLLIRVTGCLPVTIRANMSRITEGPLKGIYVTDRLHSVLTSGHSLLSEAVTEDDKLFYFGCETLYYLSTPADISAASVQGTSVFNQDFLDYLETHPEKYPTVIAVDKTFPLTDAYHYNPYNYIVADWIAEVTANAASLDTDYMTLYFLQEEK